ncbi:hypothetical protein GOP47_0007113 [Adiantum capillus-veneris]|uniref:Aminotransferase n=1 Tax=Adiantum capillus-veneris TaxID=13818 RepID=A0A9D4ZJ00_ADICA|nr:hypothetical protein GOP47_0007113 [Adiantum capillus-veneris]
MGVVDVHPLVIEKAEGIYVYDNQGRKFLDALAGLWCLALGGSEERLVEAATQQMKTLPFYHSFWNRTNKPALELAEVLVDYFKPFNMSKVFFTNSGSEANDSVVKLIWYYNNSLGRSKKKKFIAQLSGYHGSTGISGSLSGIPYMHQGFDLPFPFVVHCDSPHYYKNHKEGESEEEFATRLADNLERLIVKEGPENIAAFIAEPVMGSGGVIPPPTTYFEKVQRLLKKYDILFIADEVVCGFGRLGTTCGSEKYKLEPDFMILAKALSSAYLPIGALLTTKRIADVILDESNKHGQLGHGFTYGGHPVSCAVAIEAIKIYRERNIAEYVRNVSPVFQDGMRALNDSPIIGEIRGLGLIMAVEFSPSKDKYKPFPPEWGIGAHFRDECIKEGLLVRISKDMVLLSPALIITEEEIKLLISKFKVALKRTEKHVAELQKAG